MTSLAFIFFLRIALASWSLLWFYTHLRTFCSISVKVVTGIVRRIALNLSIALGNMAILTMLIIPVYEHKISFHYFVSSSMSFNNHRYNNHAVGCSLLHFHRQGPSVLTSLLSCQHFSFLVFKKILDIPLGGK